MSSLSDEMFRRKLLPAARNTAITQRGIRWTGNEETTYDRRILFSSPFAIYPATYIFRAYPDSSKGGTNASYWTMFFWGNDGNFNWDAGSGNTYYGAHPYPSPPPSGAEVWEISVNLQDYLDDAVVFGRWYTQVFRAWRESSTLTHHEYYWDYDAWLLDSNNGLLTQTVNDINWADTNPPSPSIVIGQAPNYLDQSWGGFVGYEEYKGILRGFQFYDALLTMANVATELATPGAFRTPWYLNLNPTVADISDKSGSGNNPVWDGPDRPADWSQ